MSMSKTEPTNTPTPEAFLTIKEAARVLRLPYWKILRSVNENLIPHYSLLNSRKLVKISEIVAAFQPSVNGGSHA